MLLMEERIITINAEGKALGRVASRVAAILIGKNTAAFKTNKVSPVEVVVYNAAKVGVSGKKRDTKQYKKFSGYPGGLKYVSFDKLAKRDPTLPLLKAIECMIPKNKLKGQRLRNLKLYAYGKED